MSRCHLPLYKIVTILLSRFLMLHPSFPCLTYFITGKPYLLTTFILFISPPLYPVAVISLFSVSTSFRSVCSFVLTYFFWCLILCVTFRKSHFWRVSDLEEEALRTAPISGKSVPGIFLSGFLHSLDQRFSIFCSPFLIFFRVLFLQTSEQYVDFCIGGHME